MSDNGQQVPLPGCMIGPSEPCDAFQRQTARIAELEAALAAEREQRKAAEALLHAKGEMLFAVVQGAKEEFVRVPYGASHEDVAAINEWHKMAAEALSEWENKA